MAEEYAYQKKRTEFGRHATFEDTDTRIVGAVPYRARTLITHPVTLIRPS